MDLFDFNFEIISLLGLNILDTCLSTNLREAVSIEYLVSSGTKAPNGPSIRSIGGSLIDSALRALEQVIIQQLVFISLVPRLNAKLAYLQSYVLPWP